MTNKFYHGDCLFVMNHDIEPNSIDLIYLDPPFFTGKVQKDTTKWNPAEMEISYDDSRKFWGDTEKVNAMRTKSPEWLKHIAQTRPDFASYLFYMTERLQACRKVLSNKGSIYLHCDYRASHYLKMIMDEPNLFGVDNFKNEIIWCYKSGGANKTHFSRKHQVILFYTKSNNYTFNYQTEKSYNRKFKPYRFRGIEEFQDEIGWYTMAGMKDYWLINMVGRTSHERVGYPSQKPLALLGHIILASSNEGDIVLDPFCGCGTAIIEAQILKRQWIGIDINHFAYKITKDREVQLPLLQQGEFGKAQYISRDLSEVQQIEDGWEFERWVNQFYKATKPSPDRGIDGITKDGIPIQSKTYEIKQKELSLFLNDVKYHPKVPQPIMKVIAVSKVGFDDSARKLKDAAETKEGIKVDLLTPSMMLEGGNKS